MYGNNSIVSLGDIGEGRRALLCITSETGCCRKTDNNNINIIPLMREWYFPNGSSVHIEGDGHSFYCNRGPSIVRPNRKHNVTSLNGTFWCTIPSSIAQSNRIMTSTIHIGIYDIGQGHIF